ncbi:hypothetical protein [Anaerocellum danielii]|uniref:Uncharacterized protein n=1 Tax=Anaerocellum danielii TaxID=1387557 RepID=A0ABZ0U4N0_9FIRM|nr:hypothetical protein [Caldicellulosiruptor danielii]WPX09663.1 hypothetical protein SOJ16_000896 [Caldicellulosiruptor danielii]
MGKIENELKNVESIYSVQQKNVSKLNTQTGYVSWYYCEGKI